MYLQWFHYGEASLARHIGDIVRHRFGLPEAQRNPAFLEQLAQVTGKDEPVMFLCRSGARSHSAAIAATQAGWKEAYNVLEGFEGDRDADGHRNSVGGWKVARLPWLQS